MATMSVHKGADKFWKCSPGFSANIPGFFFINELASYLDIRSFLDVTESGGFRNKGRSRRRLTFKAIRELQNAASQRDEDSNTISVKGTVRTETSVASIVSDPLSVKRCFLQS